MSNHYKNIKTNIQIFIKYKLKWLYKEEKKKKAHMA